jgi:hypothetical protein
MASHNYTGSLETCLQTGVALLKGILCDKFGVVYLRRSVPRRISIRAMFKCTIARRQLEAEVALRIISDFHLC